ncbi:MAG: hypothetical protein KatS3mg057_1272 [Herpetosiphonaceae bacterium]|nr:MAG: hypothetical protein KatS3mg057_1272 [Herpetosiphonaceae bacterium]
MYSTLCASLASNTKFFALLLCFAFLFTPLRSDLSTTHAVNDASFGISSTQMKPVFPSVVPDIRGSDGRIVAHGSHALQLSAVFNGGKGQQRLAQQLLQARSMPQAAPLSISRTVSELPDVDGINSTLLVTFTIANNQLPAVLPTASPSLTVDVTETLNIISRIVIAQLPPCGGMV